MSAGIRSDPNGGKAYIQVDGEDILYIKEDGYVGINTTPDATLHVLGSAGGIIRGESPGAQTQIRLISTAAGGGNWSAGVGSNSSGSTVSPPGGFHIRNESGTPNTPFSITSDNKVQINFNEVAEYETNSNGDYVRFYNGIQVCMHTDTITQFSSNTNRMSYTWSYPASFVSSTGRNFMSLPLHYANQFNNITGGESGRLSVISYGGQHPSQSNSSANFTVWMGSGSVGSTSSITNVSFFAIGRWQ